MPRGEHHRLSRGRVWFYRPQWWWPRWSPVMIGHDEFARKTLVVGWAITGQVVVALGWCGDEECIRDRDAMLRELGEEPW